MVLDFSMTTFFPQNNVTLLFESAARKGKYFHVTPNVTHHRNIRRNHAIPFLAFSGFPMRAPVLIRKTT